MKHLLLLLFVACTISPEQDSKLNDEIKSVKDLEENRNMIAIDMSNFNTRIRAKLVREEKVLDFGKFSAEEYVAKLHQHFVPSEQEYVEFIAKKDIEIEFGGKSKVFVVCTRSKAAKLIFCDRADTAAPEFSDTRLDWDLNEKVQEYLRDI